MPIYLTQPPEGAFPSDLGHWQRHDLHVVYSQADPGDVSIGAAAMTILERLGKRADVAGGRDGAHENVSWLPIWLRAHQTQWLIIADPRVLRPTVLATLLRVLTSTPADILIAARQHIDEETTAVLDGYAPTPVTWGHVPRLLPQAPASGAAAPSAPIQPPTSDWYRYRADCQDLLPADEHAHLDTHYVDALASAQQWLDTNNPDQEATRRLLAQAVAQTSNLAEGLTRVRAIQAAFFSGGWHLRIHQARLMQSLAAANIARFTKADWTALRAYRPPYRSAVIALHQTGMPASDLMSLTIGDIGDALTTGRYGDYTISPDARPFLAAQLLQRVTEHATESDPYITGVPRTPGDVINRAARDLGLLIGTHRQSTNANTLSFWQFRTGFSLTRL